MEPLNPLKTLNLEIYTEEVIRAEIADINGRLLAEECVGDLNRANELRRGRGRMESELARRKAAKEDL